MSKTKSFVIACAALAFASIPGSAFAASCPAPTFTAPGAVRMAGSDLLIVTHPSTMWDGRYSSKAGMDAAVQMAKKNKMPVIYLQDGSVSYTNSTYFFSDCNPTYWVESAGGEFSFDVTATRVYSVGGHWELCQQTTQRDLMESWRKNAFGKSLTFTQIMDGLYTYGGYFRASDSFYSDFQRFMEIVFYGNPRQEWYVRKLNLLESMGIVKDPLKQIEFLKRNLPPYSQFTGYEVELWLNGKKVEVLQKGASGTSPVMKLEFVNSVYTSGYIPAVR